VAMSAACALTAVPTSIAPARSRFMVKPQSKLSF
jgi:hypothetical protein